MKQVILLHNPKAGDEDLLKGELISTIEKEGYISMYYSIKKDAWRVQIDNADITAVAGGDGTVRTVAKELVKRNALDKQIPIALMPTGTANNLSKTLGIDADSDDITDYVKRWKNADFKKFDVGVVKNTDVTDFFLESVGFGVFPKLIKKMGKVDKSGVETKQDEIKLALKVLHGLVASYPVEKYKLTLDNEVIELNCLMLEVMNIKSIGPNLFLAKDAQTDDCLFDVIYVEEADRKSFAASIEAMINDEEFTFEPKNIRAKQIEIISNSQYMHIDDELTIPMKNPILVEIRENVLQFLV